MRFNTGEAYEGQFENGPRKAVVAEIRDEGRAGLLRFLDTSEETWVLWIELHQDGKWRKVGKVQKTEAEIRALIDDALKAGPPVCPASMTYAIERQKDGHSWKVLPTSNQPIAWRDCMDIVHRTAFKLAMEFELS